MTTTTRDEAPRLWLGLGAMALAGAWSAAAAAQAPPTTDAAEAATGTAAQPPAQDARPQDAHPQNARPQDAPPQNAPSPTAAAAAAPTAAPHPPGPHGQGRGHGPHAMCDHPGHHHCKHHRAWRERRRMGEGMGQFLIGAALLDLSSLNDRLQSAGYDKLDEFMTVIGGEGHGVLDSGAVFGARGAAILGPGGDGPTDVRTSIGGGFGMFEAGYAPVHSRHLLLMVLGGFGGYGLGIDIEQEREARFDDVLADPRRGVSMGSGGILLGLTLGIDGRVPMGESQDGSHPFFTFGLRVSGMYGPQLSDWEMGDGSRVTGAPNGRLLGVYAAAVIGFGAYSTPGAPQAGADDN